MSDGYTYAATTTTASMKSVLQSFKEADWLVNYEVDPSWSKFCSFGPDDIGSVWEKIGAIRKRPRFDTVVMSPEMLNGISNIASAMRNDPADARDYALFGLRIAASSYIPLNRIALLSTKSV